VPTVLREEGFVFRIYFEDHEPAHVHVWKGGGWAVILLPSAPVPAAPVCVVGMKKSEVARAVRLVRAHGDRLGSEWKRIHDPPTH
jgi:hypothetical protein